jgi:hypothetical protein
MQCLQRPGTLRGARDGLLLRPDELRLAQMGGAACRVGGTPAGPGGRGAALPVPGDRGPGSFTRCVNDPLGELAGPEEPRCALVRPDGHPRHPPSPKPGRAERIAAARPPRQPLRLVSRRSRRRRCSRVAATSLHAPRLAGCHVACGAASPQGRGSLRAGRPTALSPRVPRAWARGDGGGIFRRWAGKPAHCFGCVLNIHPQPLPAGRGHAHPPPARGRERGVRARGSVF